MATAIRYPRCSFKGCKTGSKTLYNIAMSAQKLGLTNRPVWRCLDHLPDDLTFVAGLHGDEAAKAGRKEVYRLSLKEISQYAKLYGDKAP